MKINCYEQVVNCHVETILKAAKNFYIKNKNQACIENTFGYFTNHIVSGLNKKRLSLVLSFLLSLKKNKDSSLKVLDVACGSGLISRAVSELGIPTLGIDSNLDEILLAKDFSKFLPTETYLEFLTVDIINDTNWEIKVEEKLEGKPDVIMLCYALHHFKDVENFLKKIAKWLEKGRYLLINEENPISPLFRLKHLVRTYRQRDTYLENHKSFYFWKKILKKNDFKIIKRGGVDPIPYLGNFLPDLSWSIVFLAEKI